MSNIVLTERELKLKMAQIYKEEKLNQIKKTWDTFNKNEKLLVVEFYKQIHPESKLLSEAKWYNWVGDILGFIPGLELVNIVNGVSYWRQGEKLFAILSFLAGIPGLGMILGPVKTLVKGGGAIARLFKGAIAVGDVSKLSKLGSISSVIGKFISAVSKWGGKLMTILGNIGKRVPFLKTIIGGIEKLINVFKGAKTKMSAPTKLSTVSTPTVSPLSTLGSSGLTSKGGSDPFGGLLSSLLGK